MTPELDEFLTDLEGRRERLLHMVSPTDGSSALVEELTELGEQLIIAEEELRVQQEEMTAALTRMQALVNEREELRSSAAHPYVLTDRRGVVLRSNAAAGELIRQPPARTMPRPIATWFEVADRTAIRTMISHISSGQSRVDGRAELRRSDGTVLPVRVTVTATPATDLRQLELLWRLEAEEVLVLPATREAPPTGDSARLQLVTEPEPANSAASAPADALTGLAVELARCESEEELLALALDRARQLIPGAQHAGVLLVGRGHVLEASGDETAAACLQREIALQDGPALAGLAERSAMAIVDTLAEPRWTGLASALAELGIRSALSVSLPARYTVLGALSVYAERPNAFGEAARSIASMLAVQVGVAVEQLRTVQNLRAGMVTRATIGEAIGVLMERHKVTNRQAFELLVQASQHANVKLRDVAKIVAETGQDPATLRVR